MVEDRDPEERIQAVVGLGNPGLPYRSTRHNVGFEVLDRVAACFSISVSLHEPGCLWGEGWVYGDRLYLIKPTTYMNRSGEAVEEFLAARDLQGDRIVVVHDDIDLPLGRLRIARRGGAGGHRGVSSIIEHLRHDRFPRVKVGIGRPRNGEPIEEYVLQRPYADQGELMAEALDAGADAVRLILKSGLTQAMNAVNGRKVHEGQSAPHP